MALIKSISGIRGTIGGAPGAGLTPIDIVKFTYAYCATLPQRKPQPTGTRFKVVVGKDASAPSSAAGSMSSNAASPPPRRPRWPSSSPVPTAASS